jgi:hypothetical protein
MVIVDVVGSVERRSLVAGERKTNNVFLLNLGLFFDFIKEN